MIATLLENRAGEWYCSECRMRQKEIEPSCYYCGRLFSNYEEVALKLYKMLLEEELHLT